MHAVTRYIYIFFAFLVSYTSKSYTHFFKKAWRPRFFKLFQALFIYKKLAAGDDAH